MAETISHRVIRVDTTELRGRTRAAKWGSILSRPSTDVEVKEEVLGLAGLSRAYDETDLFLYVLPSGEYRFRGSTKVFPSLDTALESFPQSSRIIIFPEGTEFISLPDTVKIWESAKPYVVARPERL